MNNVYIIDGCRTPVGKTNGILSKWLPEKLGAVVLNQLLQRNMLDSKSIDEVILGNAVGPGGNIARLTLLEAGWDYTIPATTIDYQCGSGMKSILIGTSMIKAGEAELIVAGGLESTSLEPDRRYHRKDPKYKGENAFYKKAQFSPDHIGDPDMLTGAENTGERLNISKQEMDEWAIFSHKRANVARKYQYLEGIIVPIEEQRKDESIRGKMSTRLLEKIEPLVKVNGSITCGNACSTHDGACALLLASEEAIKKYNLKPVAKIERTQSIGVDPNYPPIGAIASVKKLLKRTNLSPEQIDAYEVNEAFAVKVLAFIKALGIPKDQINIWGGGLAYGHPYGASGAMITLHLTEILRRENKELGIATIGVAGGQGAAILIKRVNEPVQ